MITRRLRAHVGQLRVPQGARVVDDRRPGRDRRPRHRRFVGVDRHQRAQLPRDPLDQRHDARDLLLRRDRRPVGDARFAADVDHVRPRLELLGGERHPLAERAAGAIVREGVGRRVDDSHQPDAAAEAQLAPGGAQDAWRR
jgi:hypothetical protein